HFQKQVYFHKTRAAYDIHLRGAMEALLPSGKFPPPSDDGLKEYRDWHDWRVLGLLAAGRGGEHGQRLLTRNHYRLVYQSKESRPDIEALISTQEELKRVKEALKGLLVDTKTYPNTWYKQSTVDIPVVADHDSNDVRPLSEYSSLLRNFTAQDQELLYVIPENGAEAKRIVEEVVKANHDPQLKIEFETAKRKVVASAS